MAVEIVATLTPVMILAIGQVATITNNTAAPLLLKRASSAPASITKPDNIIPAFTTETVSAGDKPFYGVWQAALTPSGEAIVNEITPYSQPEVFTVVYGSKVTSTPEQPEFRMLLDKSDFAIEGQRIFAHSFDLTYDQTPEQSGPILACHVNSVTRNQANISVLFGALLRGGSDARINISRYFETPRCLMDSHWHTTSRFNIMLPDDMFELEAGDVITYYETRGQDLVPDTVQPVFFLGFEVR